MTLAMTSSELIPSSDAPRDDDRQHSGLYVCERCHLAANPSQGEIEQAESSPVGVSAKLKCHHCGKWTVEWHPPSAPDRARRANGNVVVKPRLPGVDEATGRTLLEQMKRTLGL